MEFCFRCCRSIKHIPTRLICLLVTLLQAGVLNYYLVVNVDIYCTIFVVGDVIVITLFIVTFRIFYKYLKNERKGTLEPRVEKCLPISSVAWLVYSICLSVKAGIAFTKFASVLDEDSFFGPNTLQTTFALGGVIFLLLLTTLHDAKPGTVRRRYVDELTGTVVFDILDCVDSLEILLLQEDREDFPPGLEEAMIAVACINFVLPFVPLLTLSKTNYGHEKLSHRLVLLHKLILGFVVNLPLLILRMILWHGLNHGVSIFSLKNVIVIGMILYDFYEHSEEQKSKATKSTENTQNGHEMDKIEYSLEDRFSY